MSKTTFLEIEPTKFVIPAQVGIQGGTVKTECVALDSHLRGNDELGIFARGRRS